jgi:hypothetical protein
MAGKIDRNNAPFAFGGSQVWYPEFDESPDDPFRGDPDSDDVVAILNELHRPAANAFRDMWSGFADTDRYWR